MKSKVLVIGLMLLAVVLSGCLESSPTIYKLPEAEECVDLIFPNFEITVLEPEYAGNYEITFDSTDFGNGWTTGQKTIRCMDRFDWTLGETEGYLYCRCAKSSQTEYNDFVLKINKQSPAEEQHISLVIDPNTKSIVEYGCCVPLN